LRVALQEWQRHNIIFIILSKQTNNKKEIMFRLLACTTLLLVSASALVPQPPQSTTTTNRRQLLGSLFGAGIVAGVAFVAPQPASATKALTGPGSVFSGDYDDPNHPGCLRQVKVVGSPLKGDGTRSPFPNIEVKGWDGKEGAKTCKDARPERSEVWSVGGKLKSKEEASFDFSSKGGPANLLGKWDTDGILFPDGNKWTKVLLGTPDRRPVDRKTLTSESSLK
jgi:hypothetical protein